MQAIVRSPDGFCTIQEDDCVECGVCSRSAECPNNCFQQPADKWPRSIRGWFSDPLVEHRGTRVPGRGTEEMKTNDVTGRFSAGQVGLVVEAGRPGIGVRFRDVQVFTSALASLGVYLVPANPLSSLLTEHTRGILLPEILNEKVLSVVIECVVSEWQIPGVLAKLKEIEPSVPTVFTVGLIRRPGSMWEPILFPARQFSWPVRLQGKVNVGLGCSPVEDFIR